MVAGLMGLTYGAANGVRATRAMGAVALFALLALGAFASTARAEPLSMTFTEGRANVGNQLDDDVLFTAPKTAPFAAEINPSGLITGGQLTVPAFVTHIVAPYDADVTVVFNIGTIFGGFDRGTGGLTGTGFAGGTLTSKGESCTVSTDPAPLTLSTAGNSGGTAPRSGVPFTNGLTGAGAVAGEWDNMEATPVDPGDSFNVDVCATVAEEIGGPGGIWLQQQGDIVAPAAPQLTSTDPASSNLSGTPRIRGVAEAGSTVKVYAGSGCAGALVATGSAAELGSPGLPVAVPEGVTAFFSATATDAAGNASTCSAQIAYTRLKAPAIGPGEGDDLPPPLPPACTVPKLAGKTLKQAKKALKRADCKVGKVTKPKKKKGQKQLPPLVVKSSSPRPGAKPADNKVDLKLGPKPKPKKARR